MSPQEKKQFLEEGFILRHGFLEPHRITVLKKQLEACLDQEAQKFADKNEKDRGLLLAAPIYGGAFLDLVSVEELFEPVNALLGDTCIIHVYTSSSLPPHGKNYGNRIHHERSDKYPDILDFIIIFILLDDFTEENGATWYLPRSHKNRTQPSEEKFYREATRLVAPAGSALYFDWRLYHAGGFNHTNIWRHALAMGMTPAYQKQKIDLPRAIPSEFTKNLSEFQLQKLGFFSVPPTSLEEYYRAPAERSYKQKPI
ncbi:MAG: hypothetical protein LDLANPLL_02859 [Turneriella sp.]|nr:hypothetical protein [Turneriella sp.]